RRQAGRRGSPRPPRWGRGFQAQHDVGIWFRKRPATMRRLSLMVRYGAQVSARSSTVMPLLMARSEEHTSELQSRFDLVCRLLLEKKKTQASECRTLANSTTTHRRHSVE